MDDFNIFYYKKQDKEILNIIDKHYNSDNQAKIENLNTVLEALEVAKMSAALDEDKYDKIADEIELMQNIQDFGTESELIVKDIQFLLNKQINDINDGLKTAKQRMVANEYFKYEAKRIMDVRELTERVIRNVRFLLDVNEN